MITLISNPYPHYHNDRFIDNGFAMTQEECLSARDAYIETTPVPIDKIYCKHVPYNEKFYDLRIASNHGYKAMPTNLLYQ